MLLFGMSMDTHTHTHLVFILCSACIVKSRCTLGIVSMDYVLIIIIMVPTKKNLLNNN